MEAHKEKRATSTVAVATESDDATRGTKKSESVKPLLSYSSKTTTPSLRSSNQLHSGSTIQTTTHPTKQKVSTTRWRWIPRKLLKAQGYYEGVSKIWLPKRLPTTPNGQPHINTQAQRTMKQDEGQANLTKTQPTCSISTKQSGTGHSKDKWVPKLPTIQEIHRALSGQASTSKCASGPIITRISPKVSFKSPTTFNTAVTITSTRQGHDTIQQRAVHLQRLLFGAISLDQKHATTSHTTQEKRQKDIESGSCATK